MALTRKSYELCNKAQKPTREKMYRKKAVRKARKEFCSSGHMPMCIRQTGDYVCRCNPSGGKGGKRGSRKAIGAAPLRLT